MRRTCVPQFKVSTLTRKNNDFYSCHFSVENYQAIPSYNPGHARTLNSNNESSPRTASVMSHKYDCISGLLLVGCRLCQQLYRLK